MTNSSLVVHTNISPNKTSPRNHVIDTITIHCVVGQVTAESLGAIFAPTTRKASSNYGVDKDGRIGLYVEEKDRSWCSSNAENDNRAITIEVASDTTEPYAITDKAYNGLIDLCVDICKRNNIEKLVWSTDKNERVNHINGCNMTVHRDYAAKSCPGTYIYERLGQIANEVNSRLGVKIMEKEQFISEMASIIQKTNLIFGFSNVSVPLAQSILESGWGTSELATKANNYFGLKHRDNRCPSACGTYSKVGSEQNKDGSYTSSVMLWEKFENMEKCVKGYYEFLSNAGGRYDNLKGVMSAEIYARLIKDDGYATSLDYSDKLLKVIKENDLTRFDTKVNKSISIEELKELQRKINALIDSMM